MVGEVADPAAFVMTPAAALRGTPLAELRQDKDNRDLDFDDWTEEKYSTSGANTGDTR